MSRSPGDDGTIVTVRRRVATWIGPVFALTVFSAAVVLLHRELKGHSWQEIWQAVAALPPRRIALAVALTCLNYSVLSGYDGLAVWYMRRPLPLWRIMMGAFVGYALSHNFTWMLGGTTSRFRLYTAWGFSPVEVIKLFALIGLTFWIGYSAVAGVVFVTEPLEIPAGLHAPHWLRSTYWLGPILLAVFAIYLTACSLGRPIDVGRWRLEFPPLKLAVMQTVVATCDLLLYSAVLYVLMPPDLPIGFFRFANIVLLAIAAVLLSHVPAGVGVLEFTVLALVPYGDTPALFGSLLAFRMIFYLLPLSVAVALLAAHELAVHSKR